MKRFLILSALLAMLCGCCNVEDIESNNNGSTIDSNTNTDNNQGNGNTGSSLCLQPAAVDAMPAPCPHPKLTY